MPTIDVEDRLSKLESGLQHTIRAGKVTQTYPDKGTVRVQFEDADELVSHELPVLFRSTLKDKNYNIPDVGEHVVCNFQGHGQEQGFVMGCIYSKPDKVPVKSQDKYHHKFNDGTTIEYDRSAKRLEIKAVGDVYVEAAKTVTIKAPEITLDGNVLITGRLHVRGDVTGDKTIIDAVGNTNHHSH